MQRLMQIPWDAEAVFLSRPNRFLALCDLEGGEEPVGVHVRDPGRLEELLFPGNRLLLARGKGTNRKTKWDLIAAMAADSRSWVLVNSGFHSSIANAILQSEDISPYGRIRMTRPEITVGNSRLDFLVMTENDEEIYIEVKGCTLERDGVALFPDAPTSRGARHLRELIGLVDQGRSAAVFFLIFCPGVSCFSANDATDPAFARMFERAIIEGVDVRCFLLEYGKDYHVCYRGEIPLCKKPRGGY